MSYKKALDEIVETFDGYKTANVAKIATLMAEKEADFDNYVNGLDYAETVEAVTTEKDGKTTIIGYKTAIFGDTVKPSDCAAGTFQKDYRYAVDYADDVNRIIEGTVKFDEKGSPSVTYASMSNERKAVDAKFNAVTTKLETIYNFTTAQVPLEGLVQNVINLVDSTKRYTDFAS